MSTSDRSKLMKCTCVRCGKEFEATHKTSICEDCKIQKCVVCGSEFELKWPYTAETCSSKCRGEYRRISGKGKLAAHKASNTLKERCGFSNPGAISLKPKKCAYCGKVFTPTSNRQKYCKDKHYGACPVCGKLVEIKDMSIGPQACSEQCRQKRIQETCEDKYGSTCAIISDHAKSKSKDTCLTKYGVDHYSKTSEYKQRFQTTMIDRYGNSIPLRVESIREKQALTNQQRYGGNSPMCSEEVKEKAKSTVMLNHGGFGMASEDIRSKIESTNLEKYGVKYPAQNDQIKAKMEETCRKLYGYSNWLSSEERLINCISDSSKLQEYLKFSNDPESYIEENYDHTPTCVELCRDTGVTDTTVYSILLRNNCRHLATFHQSSMEVEVYQFLLESLEPNDIIRNCRSEITPLELDFYIPSYRFAIECNPTITHNSSFNDPWDINCKSPSYHKKKSDLCMRKHIFLFHIFGYEWKSKKDIIKSMIRNILHADNRRIYARKCRIQSVSDSECKKFLNSNHRQGYASSSINLGLYYDDNLVSLMTFGHTRSTLGNKKDSTDSYELIRFCSKLNTSVIGGASKLFKYFVKNQSFSKIVSFSDRAHTRGNLYEMLGFQEASVSYPSYVWVNISDDSYYTRVACQKRNLRRLFHDDTIDIENNTERQIMEEHGYARVYDSGVIRWEYTK